MLWIFSPIIKFRDPLLMILHFKEFILDVLQFVFLLIETLPQIGNREIESLIDGDRSGKLGQDLAVKFLQLGDGGVGSLKHELLRLPDKLFDEFHILAVVVEGFVILLNSFQIIHEVRVNFS